MIKKTIHKSKHSTNVKFYSTNKYNKRKKITLRTIKLFIFPILIITLSVFMMTILTIKNNNNMKKYDSAIHITNVNEFQEALKNGATNAFIYTTLQTDDPVESDFTSEKHFAIKKITKKYEKQSKTLKLGKLKFTYVSHKWTNKDTQLQMPKHINLFDSSVKSNLLDIDFQDRIATIVDGTNSNIQYLYYAFPLDSKSTVYTDLSSYDTAQFKIYQDKTIHETIHYLNSKFYLHIKIVLIMATILCLVHYFIYVKPNL